MSPSPFVAEWIAQIAAADGGAGAKRALDVAMGHGRHAVRLARAGYRTFGVDVKFDAVRTAVLAADSERLTIRGWCADLTQIPLPPGYFDIVVIARYLQRDLFEPLRITTTPGGVVLYETFTVRQRALGHGPTSPDHLLEPGELRARFEGFDVLFYEEVSAPDALARIAARRPAAVMI